MIILPKASCLQVFSDFEYTKGTAAHMSLITFIDKYRKHFKNTTFQISVHPDSYYDSLTRIHIPASCVKHVPFV